MMQEDLKKQYQLRFSQIQVFRNKVWRILCSQFFQPYIDPQSHILDLGCGWGEFINNIRGSRKLAIDLNSDTQGRVLPSVEFIHQDCSEPWPLPSECLDVVFTSNFLEHLPSKMHVSRTISEAKRCLKPGGKLICLGPNIRVLNGQYWDFWDHHVPISDHSLAELLKMHDFWVTESYAKFLPYSMSNTSARPLFLVKLYLKLPLAWHIFGKQFLLIASKTP